MAVSSLPASAISHAMAVTLDHYIGKNLFQQAIQQKPLVRKLEGSIKTYPGGREHISIGVKMTNGNGGVNDGLKGYAGDDRLAYYNPANGRRAEYVWREMFLGIVLTETELKQQGVTVVDDRGKEMPIPRGSREVLAPIMDEAMADLNERYADSLHDLLWGDGTADPKGLHGIRAIIQDIPTEGTVGGISAATNPAWRNRAYTAAFYAASSYDSAYGGNKVTSSTADGGTLISLLDDELIQLRRYGGNPDCFFVGSDFLSALKKERRANGFYSETGFSNGKQDSSMADLYHNGIEVVYDPKLDDIGRSKFGYLFDSRDIKLYGLKGNWRRRRVAERPYDQFVFHTGIQCTGQLTCRRRNSSLVIEIN